MIEVTRSKYDEVDLSGLEAGLSNYVNEKIISMISLLVK